MQVTVSICFEKICFKCVIFNQYTLISKKSFLFLKFFCEPYCLVNVLNTSIKIPQVLSFFRFVWKIDDLCICNGSKCIGSIWNCNNTSFKIHPCGPIAGLLVRLKNVFSNTKLFKDGISSFAVTIALAGALSLIFVLLVQLWVRKYLLHVERST